MYSVPHSAYDLEHYLEWMNERDADVREVLCAKEKVMNSTKD